MQARPLKIAPMSVAGVAAHGVRNLAVLNAIESTVSALSSDCEIAIALRHAYAEMHASLRTQQEPIDQEGRFSDVLEKAANVCTRIVQSLRNRLASARSAPEITPDDGVIEAYEAFIECMSDLHDDIMEIREWVLTHDAVLQPSTSEVFHSVDAMFDAMGVPR